MVKHTTCHYLLFLWNFIRWNLKVSSVKKSVNWCNALLTIEPFGVVLCGPKRRHVPQAPVDNRVTSREVDHCGGIQFTPLCHHCGGVVAGVIGTACNAIHCVQNLTDVGNLTEGNKNIRKFSFYIHKKIDQRYGGTV